MEVTQQTERHKLSNLTTSYESGELHVSFSGTMFIVQECYPAVSWFQLLSSPSCQTVVTCYLTFGK